MSQTIVFLDNKDGKQFAMLNIENFLYIDGSDETEEHPSGSKTRVWTLLGPSIVIDIPYMAVFEMVKKNIADNYEYAIKFGEAVAQRRMADTEEMMGRVLHPVLHPDH